MPQIQMLPGVPSFGEKLGQALGGGIGEGISGGIQSKIENMQKGKSYEAAGWPRFLANLPPEVQKEYIKNQRQNQMLNFIFYGNQQDQMSPTAESSPQAQQQPGVAQREFNPQQEDLKNQALATISPEVARIRESQQAPVRKASVARGQKYLDEIEKLRNSTQRSMSALAAAKNALESKDFGFFSRDNLSRMTGIEGLASKEGAVFDAAAKQFFLADIEAIVGRPNIFLEKILSNAIFNSGKSNEANEALLKFYENQIDLADKKLEISDSLEDHFMKTQGYVPGNISSLVNKQLKPYAEQKEKELETMFEGSKIGRSVAPERTVKMRDPSGNLRAVPKADAKKAQEAGYKLEK